MVILQEIRRNSIVMTKIYTKKGDQGRSSLPGGPQISKASPVFAVLGQLDQVNATIGILAAEDIADYGLQMLLDIQKKIMGLGSIVAGVENEQIKNQITAVDIEKLENEIDSMNEEMPNLRNFILPGGSKKSALAHLVRSEVRTLERRLVGYQNLENEFVIKWVNRLSDFFFTLARYFNYIDKIDDIIW